MRTFKQFIFESKVGKNVHLEHIEDEVFNGGIIGTRKALNFLISLRNLLAGNSKSKVNVSVKWDGAPAIVCGVNPENGKFFVGTKSVFNKNGKLNYTFKDIEQNHPGTDLQEKLKICLMELPKLGIKGILQGDLLFTKGEVKSVEIQGTPHVAFRANTITYAIPKDSDLAQKVLNANLGVVFHTAYSGKTISDLKASFGVNSKSFRNTSSVWATDATFKDTSGNSTLTADETIQISALLSEIGHLFNQMNSNVVNRISSDENLRSLIKMYTNAKIKTGLGIEGSKKYAEGLVSFIEMKYQEDMEALKTEKGKQGKLNTLNTLKDILISNRDQLIIMFRMSELMTEVKIKLLDKMKKIQSIGSFLETENGFKVTAPEGFVASDSFGNVVKLVDRLEFSRANFNATKDWR